MCTGCAVCACVCPLSAIIMRLNESEGYFQPSVDENICTACGLCQNVCPALTWANQQQQKTWGPSLGYHLKAFAAYSSDVNIRKLCASGGFVTSFLCYLLENDEISGAIVSRRKTDNPLLAEAFLARTAKDICGAKGSLYAPVNFEHVYKDLNDLTPDKEKIAFVGLPCHIEALHNLARIKPKIQNMIKFKISLVCGGTPSLFAYDYTLKKLKIDKNDIKELQNRGDGWPGYLTIILKNGASKRIPHGHRYSWGTVFGSPLVTPLACELCPDPSGFHANVSVCDAWLKKFSSDTMGINLILIRTKKILMLIEQMAMQGKLKTLDCSSSEFVEANKTVFLHKLVNRQYGLPFLINDGNLKYHKYIQYTKKFDLITKLKLFIYYTHIRLIKFVSINRIYPFLNDIIFFYFKVIKLLRQ